MGEAINIIEKFKVKNVIFNCGELNNLEKNLINILNKKSIKYYSCIKKISNLEFLQTREYDNENDNSNVIYLNIYSYKFLFMGDAGISKEEDIINKYNLSNIDFLKVGHHGSHYSTCEEFLEKVKPEYGIISCSATNTYGHPAAEIVERLKNAGCQVGFTMKSGAVTVHTDGEKIWMEGYVRKTW